MNEELENELDDDLRPEYDFANMTGGVRGKYVERYRAGTNIVLLEPDVAAAFPNAESVNTALRELLNRRAPNAPKYNFPDTEEGRAQTADVIRRKIAGEL
jgi:hypothetical protein